MNQILHQAYLQTTYSARTPRGELRVRIGQTHPELDGLLSDYDAVQWAYITAWNPSSQLLSPHENLERQKELEEELRDAGYVFFRGNGIPDNDDEWDPEGSALVVGTPRKEAVGIGARYGQNAIVCGRLGEAAELVWCDNVAEAARTERASVEVFNVFDVPAELPGEEEFFEVLADGDDVRIERIISHGHTTPEGEWYDQREDEWVVLLQGEATLEWEDGTRTQLEAGDAVFIEARRPHRVTRTSVQPPCVWLAIHGKFAG